MITNNYRPIKKKTVLTYRTIVPLILRIVFSTIVKALYGILGIQKILKKLF